MYGTTPSTEKLVERMQAYGVQATGEVVDHEYHDRVSYSNEMTLREVSDNGGRVSRVRVLKEFGRCDISYIHATLKDGTIVPVRLGGLCTNWYRGLKGDLITWAKEEGVFAKGVGLLDEGNWAVLG